MQLSDFSPGMQAWYGRRIVTVIKPAVKRVHITVNGKTRAVLPSELDPVSSVPVAKFKSTAIREDPKPPRALNSRQRRLQRRSGGATDISRMMLPAL